MIILMSLSIEIIAYVIFGIGFVIFAISAGIFVKKEIVDKKKLEDLLVKLKLLVKELNLMIYLN